MKLQIQLVTMLLTVILVITPVSAQYQLNYNYLSVDTGGNVNYSSFAGKPILIDAFATWCEPCRTEILHIKEVNNQLGEQVKVLTISVQTDGAQDDSIAGVKKFRDEFEANWEFGIDTNKILTSVYNVTTLPSLLLFDQNGSLVKFWEGITSVDEIYSVMQNKFGISAASTNTVNDLELLTGRLFSNLAFQITFGITGLLTIIIVISNIFNRKKNESVKN